MLFLDLKLSDIDLNGKLPDEDEDDDELEAKRAREAVKPLRDALVEEAVGECGSQYEWCQYLSTRNANLLLGQDSWECGDWGEAISIRCASHLVGLKMAYEQLEKEGGGDGISKAAN